jgi:hypothetical protein
MEKSDKLIKFLVDREVIKYKLEQSKPFGFPIAAGYTDSIDVTIISQTMEINI